MHAFKGGASRVQIVVTVVVIVVVLGFALWVFSRVSGAWLNRTGGRNQTADQWYRRYDDSGRK
jgi:hypothetical protein